MSDAAPKRTGDGDVVIRTSVPAAGASAAGAGARAGAGADTGADANTGADADTQTGADTLTDTPSADITAAPSRAPDPASLPVPGARVLVALSLGCVAFLLLQILTYGYGRDQGIYAMVARIMQSGGMPYRDAFDFKPPGIFVIFSLARALFGAAQWGIRALEVAGLVAMALAMIRLAERWWGDRRIGLAAAALAVLVHAQLDFWHTAQPESFGGMLTLLALLVAEPRPGRAGALRGAPSPAALLGAGALLGAAGLLKPPLAGGGVILAVALALPAFRGERGRGLAAARAAVAPGALIALGGALPFVACAAWFAARGALGDLYRVLFVFTPHYTAIGWQNASVLDMAWYGVGEWLVRYSGPVVLGLLCLVALHPAPGERRGVALLSGVIAMHLAGVVMQGKFFPYHYGATWPLAAMLAALGLWKAWARAARRGPLAAAGLAAVLLAAAFARSATKNTPDTYLERCGKRLALFAAGARDQEAIDRLASVADVNAAANRAVADLLRARVPPGRPVFVWGFEPVIYDLADRAPASRYLYNVPQRVAWAKVEARDALLSDLAARPPAAIVVERYDVFPMVTGNALDSRDTLPDFPALARLIDDRYERVASIEDFDVYLERAAPAPGAGHAGDGPRWHAR